MKKLLICVLCFASVQGFAQIRLGVQGGASVANFWQTDGYTGLPPGMSNSPIGAYHAGIQGELDLNSFMVLQPALLYYENGSHLINTSGFVNPPISNLDINYANTTLKIYSLRLPVNLVFKIKVNDKVKGLFGVGAYIAKNLSGTEKGYYIADFPTANGGYGSETISVNNKVKISGDYSNTTAGTANVASIDAGGQILAGAEYKKFQLTINWSRGVSRVYRTNFANCGNMEWNFSLAYTIFGHDRKQQL